VTPRLAALVRKELIRPDTPQLPGEDGFRFRHLLIRDAAYDALPKTTRAELHERFAAWLEEHASELVELDEILGYHLEQAVRYRRELGQPIEEGLAIAARERLTAAGVRARARHDDPAAARLFERAASLVLPGQIDLALENDLLDALYLSGKLSAGLGVARSLVERAVAAGDRTAELCARIKEGVLLVSLDPEGATDDLAALLDEALPEFDGERNDVALYAAYAALGQVMNMRARMDGVRDAYERAAVHASRAGRPYEWLGWRAAGRYFGTTPVSELLAWLDDQAARRVSDHHLDLRRALALAMLGRFDEGRSFMTRARTSASERGGAFGLANALGDSTDLELLADDPAAAAAFGRKAMSMYDEIGERSFASTTAGRLAQALYELDRLDEAEEWATRGKALGASDDAITQMLWRQVRGKVLARRGDHSEAERLAREAVALGDGTDMLDAQGDAHTDLGEVLALAGRADEAAGAYAEALARYERKENVVMSERMRARLAELQATAAQ
jgi:hypothetical protein